MFYSSFEKKIKNYEAFKSLSPKANYLRRIDGAVKSNQIK